MDTVANLLPSILDSSAHVAKIAHSSVDLNQVHRNLKKDFLERYSEYRVDLKNKEVVSVLNISSGVMGVMRFVSTHILSAFKCMALCVASGFLSVVGSLLGASGAVVDTVRIVNKLNSLQARVKQELTHAVQTNNFKKEKEITLMQVSRYVDLGKNFFTIATALTGIVTLAMGISLFSPAVITFVALNIILFIASFCIKKFGRVEQIEQKYFPREA